MLNSIDAKYIIQAARGRFSYIVVESYITAESIQTPKSFKTGEGLMFFSNRTAGGKDKFRVSCGQELQQQGAYWVD